MDRSSIAAALAGHRSALLLVVGVALLLNPVVVGVTDFGDPDQYRYEPHRVAAPNGTVDVPAEADVAEPGVLCLDVPLTRPCMFERAILERGGIVYEDGLPREFLTTDYGYVYHLTDGEGRFYRPVTTEAANGSVTYTHERVPNGEALDRVSTPLREASSGVRTAITSGSYVTSDRLPEAGTLVRTDDGYYVVSVAEMHETTGERRPLVRAGQWMAAGLAVLLIYRAGARRGRQGA